MKQKKLWALGAVVVILAGALALVGWKYGPAIAYEVTHPACSVPDDAPVVAFLGDSYVEGSLRDSGSRSQWSDLVSCEKGWEQHDFAEGGSGYLVPGVRGTVLSDRINDIAALSPDMVIVSAGLNDPIDGLTDAVSATLDELRTAVPDAAVIVLTNFAPLGASDEDHAKQAAITDAAGGDAIDVTDLFDGRGDLIGADERHPTDEGHRWIAEQIAPMLP